MATLSAAEVALSRSEQEFILSGIREDCRIDGRTRQDLRDYIIVTGNEQHTDSSPPPLLLSSGSARLVSCGGGHGAMDLLCSVKAEVVHPSPIRPHEGVVDIHVDTLTTSTFSRRQCDELQATLTHLLGTDSLVDSKGLCIVPFHYVWRLQVDLYLLSISGGSLIDAASHIIRAALKHTLLPVVTSAHDNANDADTRVKGAAIDLQVDGDIQKAVPPPGVDAAPCIVTVSVLKTAPEAGENKGQPSFYLVLDATAEEETCAVAQVHVAVDLTSQSEPRVTALHKSLPGSLPFTLLPDITSCAIQAASISTKHFRLVKPSGSLDSFMLLQEQFRLQ